MQALPAIRPQLLEDVAETPGNLTDVILRAQQGDRSAFEQIYRENVGRVYAVCIRLSADRERAESLTQDVFVRAWEMLGTFRGESRLSSWLHRLAVNVVLVDFRTRRRRDAHEVILDDPPEIGTVPGHNPTAERIDLEQAIASLPPRARTVFVLHDIEGFRHEEIADQMDVAVGTTKAQLHRARKLLKEVLER